MADFAFRPASRGHVVHKIKMEYHVSAPKGADAAKMHDALLDALDEHVNSGGLGRGVVLPKAEKDK